MYMAALPKMAAEVAAPMSQVENITIVMDSDSKSGSGPGRVTQEVMDIMTNIPETVQKSTGVNLLDIVVK